MLDHPHQKNLCPSPPPSLPASSPNRRGGRNTFRTTDRVRRRAWRCIDRNGNAEAEEKAEEKTGEAGAGGDPDASGDGGKAKRDDDVVEGSAKGGEGGPAASGGASGGVPLALSKVDHHEMIEKLEASAAKVSGWEIHSYDFLRLSTTSYRSGLSPALVETL